MMKPDSPQPEQHYNPPEGEKPVLLSPEQPESPPPVFKPLRAEIQGSPPSASATPSPTEKPPRVRRSSHGLLCRHCNSREMRRQPRVGLELFSFFEPYQCGRCTKRQHRLELTWRIPAALMTLAVLGFGTYFLWNNPPNWPPTWLGGTDATQSLSRARASSGGQLSAFEEMMVRRPKSTIGNANILELTKANVRADVDFDLRANSVIELKKAGVDETVILAMIDQSYGSR